MGWHKNMQHFIRNPAMIADTIAEFTLVSAFAKKRTYGVEKDVAGQRFWKREY